ncbi:MAG: hypothetical protein IKA41_08825 [Bacteroidaceae bacterium]|nr:hypothetical protein [Bacteroidaceae bacterium]
MAFWDEDKKAKRAQKRLDTAPIYAVIGGVLFAIVFFLLLGRETDGTNTGRRVIGLIFYAVLALGMLAYGFLKLAKKEKRIAEMDYETKKNGVVAVYTDIDDPKPGEGDDEDAESIEGKEENNELLTSGK